MGEQLHRFIWQIPADHAAFAGHFPGRPIVPGVLILDQALSFAQRLLPESRWQIVQGKFLRPVGPGAQLQFILRPGMARDFALTVEHGGQVVASGKLQASAA